MPRETRDLNATGIVLAAGRGVRMGGADPKQFRAVNGKEMFRHSVECLLRHPRIRDVILVVPAEWLPRALAMMNGSDSARIRMVAGKETRQGSSQAGVAAVATGTTHVLIHDAARPRINIPLLDRILDALSRNDAVVPAIAVTDTLVRMEQKGNVASFPDRSMFRRIQTPQGFRLEIIREAHERAMRDPTVMATDDAGLVHHFHLARVFLVNGDIHNVKITNAEDLEVYGKSR
ncbi:MAG: 2-C-methyl-D-erythritol 4-phosphate cytidylyltransferase [Candidatus Aminicenantes bacterium]|nr:2-C-methyl-D-erythritol 4-phosphate cytidylyltransferase [Candidatus Aminicenantes bacterium]